MVKRKKANAGMIFLQVLTSRDKNALVSLD
jgi:hypothetical protein